MYRSELAMRLQRLGYEIERGQHGQPEIKDYMQEYLEASPENTLVVSPDNRSRVEINSRIHKELQAGGLASAFDTLTLTRWNACQ